jgi:glycolate oxidase iron-sulfur subunit
LAEFSRPFDLLECVNCGLCLEVCPTYDLGREEAEGPRGRIRLMDLLARVPSEREPWQVHLDHCVGCLACQARCPAGVPYAGMLDRAQASLRALRGGPSPPLRWALEFFIAHPERLRRLRAPLRFALWLRLPRLLARLAPLPGLGWLGGLDWLPRRLPRPAAVPPPRPAAPQLYFPGCVEGLLFPATEAALLRLLDVAGGYGLPAGWTCCGALARHLGDIEGSLRLARRNIAACEAAGPEALVVTGAAGCGAALKEYGHWLAEDPDWAERATRFSARVRDWSECLSPAQLGALRLPSPRRASYDDACHAVHAQGIAAGPRALLDAVAGLERVELPHAERCCGAGGSYFLREPLLSRAMIAGKLEDLASTGAGTLLSANPGCRLQWEAALARAGSGVLVQHPAELIAEALAPARAHKTRS